MAPSTYKGPALEHKCVNTIRAVSADQPESANSGHPGAPMGCAPMAYLLWAELMKYSPTSPKWINRDRFVLSNGHACALQYTMLHLTGYGLTIDDLSKFRQLGSKTPGHPECFLTAGKSHFFLVLGFTVHTTCLCVVGGGRRDGTGFCFSCLRLCLAHYRNHPEIVCTHTPCFLLTWNNDNWDVTFVQLILAPL